MTNLFTEPGVWGGSEFALDLFFGPLDDKAVRALLAALWRHPDLDGCWLSCGKEPEEHPCVSTDAWNYDTQNALYGIATLPNQTRCNCKSVVIKFDAGLWLSFLLPIGGLGHCYPVGGYPLGDENSDYRWILPLSEWMVGIAQYLFDVHPFLSGAVGAESEPDEVMALPNSEIPTKRWVGYLRNESGKIAWYPQNGYGPIDSR